LVVLGTGKLNTFKALHIVGEPGEFIELLNSEAEFGGLVAIVAHIQKLAQ
jgi:hypothetical protein